MEKSFIETKCGFCFRKDDAMVDPKVLPCGHVHCMRCLIAYYELNYLLVCGQLACGAVVEKTPDNLPSYDSERRTECSCICSKLATSEKKASTYCTKCRQKFPKEPMQLYTDSPDQHKTLENKAMNEDHVELEKIHCEKHVDLPYDWGCQRCLRLFCNICMYDRGQCDNGSFHAILTSKTLVDILWTCKVNTPMMRKEMEYEELFKQASCRHAKYEAETESIMELIHRKKNDETSSQSGYLGDLQRKVLKSRHQSTVEIQNFIDQLLKQWVRFRNRRHVFESNFKLASPAVLVEYFPVLRQEMDRLIKDKLPTLCLDSEVTLEEREPSQKPVLEIVPSADFTLELLTLPVPLLPNSFLLMNSLQLPACPLSVSNYKGNTYIGLENQTITKISGSSQLQNSFITCPGPVQSLNAYKDKLYTLCLAQTLTVGIYDLLGNRLTAWKHPHHAAYCDMLTVVADQVLVSDPPHQNIIVYSLDGEILRQLACPLIGLAHTVLSSFNNSSVIVSNSRSNHICRLKIDTGEILWATEMKDSLSPSFTCWRECILQATCNGNSVSLISAATGKIEGTLAEAALPPAVFSLDTSESTLFVPSYWEQQLLFYQIRTDYHSQPS